MSDRYAANQRKAEQYLTRFRAEPLGHLIGGNSIAGHSTEAMENSTPIDGSILNTVSMGGESEVNLAVEAASAAFSDWRTVSGLSLIHI